MQDHQPEAEETPVRMGPKTSDVRGNLLSNRGLIPMAKTRGSWLNSVIEHVLPVSGRLRKFVERAAGLHVATIPHPAPQGNC